MLANSSGKIAQDLKALNAEGASRLPWRGRVAMVSLNFIPMLLAGSTVLIVSLIHASLAARIGVAFAFVYLFPPLIARAVLLFLKIPEGRIAVGSRAFFAWWAVFQLQVLFCRFPAFEEALRAIPGLYSQWLRLWGSRIGRFTYWSPGTMITDRSFLLIGDDVVLGAGVRLNAHVLAEDKDGHMQLLLATVKVGDRVMVGGYSLLTSGTEIAPDEKPHACLELPPFSLWKNGKRIKMQGTANIE